MKDFDKKLASALWRVSGLEGVTSVDDCIAIKCGHLDDYLAAGYISQLLERGEMEISIRPDRIPYLLKLLHMERENER